jgi:hypothetical protein
MERLNIKNIMRGMMRLWIVIAIPWSAYFGWTAYDTFGHVRGWEQLENTYFKEWGKATIAEEEARSTGVRWENPHSLRYYKEQYEHAEQTRKEWSKKFEYAIRVGPTVPIGLLALIWAGLWIYRGFLPASPEKTDN